MLFAWRDRTESDSLQSLRGTDDKDRRWYRGAQSEAVTDPIVKRAGNNIASATSAANGKAEALSFPCQG